MNDVLVRLAVVAGIVVLAAVAARVVGRVRRPPHPEVRVGDLGDRPGVVVFTSTTCSTCKDAIAELESLDVPFREVTNELEAHRFAEWGVVAVPVTVVLDSEGAVVGTFSGVPRRRPLRRALASAEILGSGWTRS